MNRIPCKKCPQCGLYNDFTVEECECGKKLNSIEAQFVDTDELSPEEYGEIESSLKVYVQKCSACGALNYTDDPSNPVKVCYNCHKTRIAAIAPVECVEADSEDEKKISTPEAEMGNGFNAQQTANQVARITRPMPIMTMKMMTTMILHNGKVFWAIPKNCWRMYRQQKQVSHILSKRLKKKSYGVRVASTMTTMMTMTR